MRTQENRSGYREVLRETAYFINVVSYIGWSDVGKDSKVSSAGGAAGGRTDGALAFKHGSSPCEAFESLLGLNLAGLLVEGVEHPEPAGPSRVCWLAASNAEWVATRGPAEAAGARHHFGGAFSQ